MSEQDNIIEKLLQLRDEANLVHTEVLALRDSALRHMTRQYTAARPGIIYPEKMQDDTKET